MSEVECMAKRQVLPESAGLCNCAELEQARARVAELETESEYWGGMAIDNGKLLVAAEAEKDKLNELFTLSSGKLARTEEALADMDALNCNLEKERKDRL